MAVAIRHPSRALAVLAVALPVPLLAAAGLSLPLPATVERLAAKLVPFGNAAAVEAARGGQPAQGAIVLAPGERQLGAERGGTSAQPERRGSSAILRPTSGPTSHLGGRVADVSSGGTDGRPTPGSTPERATAPAAPSGATTTTAAAPTTTTASGPAPS